MDAICSAMNQQAKMSFVEDFTNETGLITIGDPDCRTIGYSQMLCYIGKWRVYDEANCNIIRAVSLSQPTITNTRSIGSFSTDSDFITIADTGFYRNDTLFKHIDPSLAEHEGDLFCENVIGNTFRGNKSYSTFSHGLTVYCDNHYGLKEVLIDISEDGIVMGFTINLFK